MKEFAVMARTRLLTRDAIARAAFDLVDAEGAPALTMGRLAVELGVAQMTLYNYAASKQDIIGLLPDVLLGDLPPIDPHAAWDIELEACFTIGYDRLIRHGNVTRLIAAIPVASTAQARLFSEMQALLQAHGFTETEALTVHRTLSTYTMGFALFELAEMQAPRPRPGADAQQFRTGLHAVLGAFSPAAQG
jgi:AcrR family transcriptional regulator